jgi:peptidoglycan/xylan/chitin deacetylase (PgdA/CDA1 family)
MRNPLAIAIKGKGIPALLSRIRTIISRYGLTGARMDRALAVLTDTLEPFGCKATLPATAVALARHRAIARKYQAQGIEFAVHGLVHVDYSQLSPDDQRTHLRRARQLFEQVGIRATGFRCPYLRWNADLLAALRDCGFSYDGSQALAWDVVDGLDTNAYRHVLSFYGAQSATDYPALPRITDDLVCVPYCLPDDEALVERLRLTKSEAMSEIWLEILARIHQAGELFTLNLHPERAALCQDALQATLQQASALSPAVWIAQLDEVVSWWRALRQATFEVTQEKNGLFRLIVKAPSKTVILTRAVEVETPTQPWAYGYQCVSANELSFRAPRRPFVGIAPDAPPALREFLRQQGYLVEVSIDAQAYSFYLQQASFGPEDERPLLVQVEQGDWPLVRLARWPDGAQSALSVTGDIDAFALWDYGLRLGNR